MSIKQNILFVVFITIMLLPVLTIAETINYTYDSLNRIVREERSNGTVIVYEYDSRGNRTEKVFSTVSQTVIKLSSFTAKPSNNAVIIRWSTESEINNVGFNLYRSESNDGKYTKINNALIPAKGSSSQGASYEFVDANVKNRKTYYYKLEDIDLSDKATMHGPVSATPRLIYGNK